MQFKLISALALATLAAANTLPPFEGNPTILPSKCTDGHLQCCKFDFHHIIYSNITNYYYRQDGSVAH